MPPLDGWKQVAAAVNARMVELGLDQVGLTEKASVSDATARQFMEGKLRGETVREGSKFSIARGLGWTPDSVDRILAGGKPVIDKGVVEPSVATRLVVLEARMEALVPLPQAVDNLRATVEALATQLGIELPQPAVVAQ